MVPNKYFKNKYNKNDVQVGTKSFYLSSCYSNPFRDVLQLQCPALCLTLGQFQNMKLCFGVKNTSLSLYIFAVTSVRLKPGGWST